MHAPLHALRQFHQLFLRTCQFLPRFREVFFGLLRDLLLLHLVLVLLDSILGLPHFSNRFLQGLAHVTLLRAQFLAHQGLRVAINVKDPPLRVADSGTTQRLGQGVADRNAHPELAGILPLVQQRTNRYHLLSAPQRTRTQTVLFR